jgi:preprotein translocase subunit YajC
MYLMNKSVVLALAPPAKDGQQTNILTSIVPMVLLFVIFYFVLIRPQQKKAKQQAEMLKTVKSGDKVVTTSGIIATVVTVKDDSITVRSADLKLPKAPSPKSANALAIPAHPNAPHEPK